MAPKLSSARIVDLDTTFDAAPIESADGSFIWVTVKIVYALGGLTPVATIRVPVSWDQEESQDQRRGRALRAARQLIDHACRAVGILPAEAETGPMENLIEAITPDALDGVAQELGLTEPTRKPKSRRRG